MKVDAVKFMARTFKYKSQSGRKKFCVNLSPDTHEGLCRKAKQLNLPQYELVERLFRLCDNPEVDNKLKQVA